MPSIKEVKELWVNKERLPWLPGDVIIKCEHLKTLEKVYVTF